MIGLCSFAERKSQCRPGRFPGTEPALYGRLTHDKALERVFQDAMSGISKLANQFLSKAMDFSSI